MSSPVTGWQNIPDLIFADIMLMAGLGSHLGLHKCRRVCKSWKVMITQMTKYKKDTIRSRAESVADMINEKWVDHYFPLPPEITTAASLAFHGVLSSVEDMYLMNVDLASVPPQHLTKLASIVSDTLDIDNVSNCDLGHLLGPARCYRLSIYQSLSSEETRVLEQTMESQVETVEIWGSEFVDMEALALYNGQGKCSSVLWNWSPGVIPDLYTNHLISWAERINWKVTMAKHIQIYISRNFQ